MLKYLIILMTFVATEIYAEPPKLEGTHKKWSHQSCAEKGKKSHYILSQPIDSKGKYTKRGEVFFLVTREDKKDIVNFVAGYTYKPKSAVSLRFNDGKTFKLFTDGDRAWAEDEATDKAIVAKMKKSDFVVVKGTSAKGNESEDKVSLAGFQAAYAGLK